jgi:hypothetical protein
MSDQYAQLERQVRTLTSRLANPFDPESTQWRVGSTNAAKDRGIALAYINARHVMDRLDEVVGMPNWKDEYEFHGDRTVCKLSLRIHGEWVTKVDAAGDTAVESEKGAMSDAFKRAAVKFGIGRYLYALDSPWVKIVPVGKKSHRIEDPGALAKLLPVPNRVDQAIEALDAEVESVKVEPAKTVTSDAPITDEMVKTLKRAVGARCKEIGLSSKDYGPMVEKSVLRVLDVKKMSMLTRPQATAFANYLGMWEPGDEGDPVGDRQEEAPF